MPSNRSEPRPPPPSSARSSVVPLFAAANDTPATTDDVPTILGKQLSAPAPLPFDLAIGSQLGHFEILGPLGAGGMASVFKAKDLTLGREVALKILPPDFAKEGDAISRFKFEARAAAKLNHDNVARVFYIGEERGLHFIAFEFVEGKNLRVIIDELGTVPPGDCARYLRHIAEGLRHAGEKGVVHRDVKPSNIVVTPGGFAKLIDMGLARALEPQSVLGGVTQSGMTLGTFDYISPEQAIDPRRADGRSDIYSLGCTFYHALTGRPPVPEGNAARKLSAHQNESPTDPRLINQTVPDEMAMVLDRMMAKKPDDRFADAGALLEALDRLAGPGGPRETSRSNPAVPIRPSRGGPPPGWFWILASGGVFAALLLIAVWPGKPKNSSNLPWTDPPTSRVGSAPEAGASDPVKPRTAPTSANVRSAEELHKALSEGLPKVTLAAGVYDLARMEGLVLSAKGLELEGVAEGPTVLRIAAHPIAETKPGEARAGGLTFAKCESVKIAGLKIEFVAPVNPPPGEPVGLAFLEVAKVEFAECRFEAVGAFAGAEGTGLQFVRSGAIPANAAFRNCFFQLKSWVGIELVGNAAASCTECGFITPRSAFEFTPGGEGGGTPSVSATHSTFQLSGAASVASINKGAKGDLSVGHCLFAAPAPVETTSNLMGNEKHPARLLAPDGPDGTFQALEGQPNAAFRVELPANALGVPVEVFTQSPWIVSPRLDPEKPWLALELNPKIKALRLPAPSVEGILGARFLPTRVKRIYESWPLPNPMPTNVRVWHPNRPANEPDEANVYSDLAQAVAGFKGAKGTLEVRGQGLIRVSQAAILSDPKLQLTVRPEEGSKPILQPVRGDLRKEATLFRLEAGELIAEGLQFRLEPSGAEGAASAASVAGGKRCEFRNCLFTLAEQVDERAAAVTVADVSDVMEKKLSNRPNISFDNCLLRGTGRLLRAAAAVPMDVSVSNVAAAITGPLIDLGSPSRSFASTAGVNLQISNCTAVLGGPLLDGRTARKATDDKPLAPIHLEIQAEQCLFAPLDKSTEPFLRCAGHDPSGAERNWSWSSAAGNGFAGWTNFAEIAADDTAEMKRWDGPDWRKWSGERPANFGRATFAKTPRPSALEKVEAADLEMLMNPFDSNIGAKCKRIPKAFEEKAK